jgi:hypothetical protein
VPGVSLPLSPLYPYCLACLFFPHNPELGVVTSKRQGWREVELLVGSASQPLTTVKDNENEHRQVWPSKLVQHNNTLGILHGQRCKLQFRSEARADCHPRSPPWAAKIEAGNNRLLISDTNKCHPLTPSGTLSCVEYLNGKDCRLAVARQCLGIPVRVVGARGAAACLTVQTDSHPDRKSE